MSEQNYETINLENLEQYSTFESKHEMDEKIYEYIDLLRQDERPESVVEVLRYFGRSSLRVLGVSFAKYETIAEKIGISKRTVMRAIKLLDDYGIIERVPTVKKWRGRSRKKSVNIIVLTSMATQADTSAEVAETTDGKASADEKQTEPLLHNHTTEHVLETATAPQPANALAKSIPAPIFKALKPFFNAAEIYKYYGVLLRAKAKINREIMLEDVGERYADVFRNVISKFKRGKVRNLAGFLFASWRELTVEIDREIAVNNDKVSDIYFDWLTE